MYAGCPVYESLILTNAAGPLAVISPASVPEVRNLLLNERILSIYDLGLPALESVSVTTKPAIESWVVIATLYVTVSSISFTAGPREPEYVQLIRTPFAVSCAVEPLLLFCPE